MFGIGSPSKKPEEKKEAAAAEPGEAESKEGP